MHMLWAISTYSVNRATCLPTKPSKGFQVLRGIALGRAVILYPPADLASVPDREADDISEELELLDHAIDSVRQEIQSLDDKMQDALMAEERALFSVFLRMLDENALPAEIKDEIRDGTGRKVQYVM